MIIIGWWSAFCLFCREDKDDQVLDYKQEVQTMEEALKKLQKEVESRTGVFWLFLLKKPPQNKPTFSSVGTA